MLVGEICSVLQNDSPAHAVLNASNRAACHQSSQAILSEISVRCYYTYSGNCYRAAKNIKERTG